MKPEYAATSEVELLADICRTSGRPLTFAHSQINDMPDLAMHVLKLVAQANREPGIEIVAQVFPRPVGILFGLDLSLHPFKLHREYRTIEHLPLAERDGEMREPDVRLRILGGEPDPEHPDPIQRFLVQRSLDAFQMVGEPDYEPDPSTSLRAIAEGQGRDLQEVALDALLEADGKALLFLPINNCPGSLAGLGDMLPHPDTVVALGDGGVHLGFICNASYPTFFLPYWTRDRRKGTGPRFSLAEAVHRLTGRPVKVVGFNDRGLLKPGYEANISGVAYEDLGLNLPLPVFDLPGGGRRLLQSVKGLVMTLVDRTATYHHGRPTGALPGRLLRGPTFGQA